MKNLMVAACNGNLNASDDEFSDQMPTVRETVPPNIPRRPIPTNLSSDVALAKTRSRLIDQEIEELRKSLMKKQRTIRILLLGSASSGKTTFIKQMQLLHGSGFSESDRVSFRKCINYNLFYGVMMILQYHMETLVSKMSNTDLIQLSKNVLSELGSLWEETKRESNGFINSLPESIVDLLHMWADEGTIKKLLDDHFEFGCGESFSYFFKSRLNECLKPGWVPTEDDILNTRLETVQVRSHEFQIEGRPHIYIDVSGQKQRRMKWMSFFEASDSVLFFAPIGNYNQKLIENSEIAYLDDALALFDTLSNHPVLQTQGFILFLNKVDLFEQKLPSYPLRNYVPSYNGDNSFKDARKYVKGLFLKCWTRPTISLYVHYTSAVDRKAMSFVIKSCHDAIVRGHISKAGFA